jgi:hypothetical protein
MAEHAAPADVRRVLVPLGPSPDEDATVALAAALAGLLHAELLVLYVEDSDLTHATALPFTREVVAVSGELRAPTARDLELDWRTHAGHLRRTLAEAAAKDRVRWRLQVRRGRLESELATAVDAGDLVLLAGALGTRRARGLAATSARRVVFEHAASSVLLARRRLRARGPILVLYDGGAAATTGARLAATLAAPSRQPLVALLSGADADARRASRARLERELDAETRRRLYFRAVPRPTAERLARLAAALHADALVVPQRRLIELDETGAWTDALDCPVLTVR